MNTLVLSWEYPPRIVGGLGKHVHALATALAAEGHEVHVVTRGSPGAPGEEFADGVHIMRVEESPPEIAFDDQLVPWVLQFNIGVAERAIELLRDERIDVVHAHDWLVAYAAAAVRSAFGVPLVATVHATEFGRHQGYLPGPMNKLIHEVEWWLAYEAKRVITCSSFMAEQVRDIFAVPASKQDVIPNGVDLGDFGEPDGRDAFRASRLRAGEKMVFFAGRLEYEKGVQTVLEALPLVLAFEDVRFFVAGVGTHATALHDHAARLGIADRVEFLGFVATDELSMFLGSADLVVVPSLYEPFGMVALETMASGTPCIAADTGGLRELVVHDATGLRFRPGDPHSLADTILRLTTEPRLAKRITVDARRFISDQFSWISIARRTVEVYRRAAEEDDIEQVPLRAQFTASPLLTRNLSGA